MFYKGVLKAYDQVSQTGTISLLNSEKELYFSIKDLSSVAVAPQVGERVKCMIEEKEGVKRAKFILRLDFKNAREEKPLNQSYDQPIGNAVNQLNKSETSTLAAASLIEKKAQKRSKKDQSAQNQAAKALAFGLDTPQQESAPQSHQKISEFLQAPVIKDQNADTSQKKELKQSIIQIDKAALKSSAMQTSTEANIQDLKSASSFEDIAYALDLHSSTTTDQSPVKTALKEQDGLEKTSHSIDSHFSVNNEQQYAASDQVDVPQYAVDQQGSQAQILFNAHAHQNNHQVSARDQLENTSVYAQYTAKSRKKNNKGQLNYWLILSVGLVLALISLAFYGYQQYTQYQNEQHAKVEQYFLEQQRIIEEQRKRLSHVPEEKVLSEKALDDLLGKDREK